MSGHLLIAAKQGQILVYDLNTSKRVYVEFSYSRELWPPAVEDGIVYIVDSNFGPCSFSVSNSEERKKWSLVQGSLHVISPPIVYKEKVYFLVSDGTLQSLDPSSGEVKALLKSSKLRHSGNIPGGYYEHYLPGMTMFSDGLIIAFGCKTLVAIQP